MVFVVVLGGSFALIFKISKNCLDTMLGNLFYGILLEKGELDLMTSIVPFQPQSCYDAVRDKN